MDGVAGTERPKLWTPDLELGIPLIDGQHKKLVQQLEEVFVAVKTRRPARLVQEALVFLDQYTQEHFHSEERFMAEHGYPGVEDHKAAHQHFRDQVTKAGKYVAVNPHSEKTLQLVQSMLVNWYIQHIKGTDQQYAKYVKNRRLAGGPGRDS